MEKETLQVATIANLIEIGKRVILKQKNDAILLPEASNLPERVAEDLGAALLQAIVEKSAKEGVVNA